MYQTKRSLRTWAITRAKGIEEKFAQQMFDRVKTRNAAFAYRVCPRLARGPEEVARGEPGQARAQQCRGRAQGGVQEGARAKEDD